MLPDAHTEEKTKEPRVPCESSSQNNNRNTTEGWALTLAGNGSFKEAFRHSQ